MADELCFSATCNFIKNPLYFSYLIFFSPYFFKFIFFISPLFFTTAFLLLLSIIATTFPQPKLGFIQSIADKLRSKLNDVDDVDEFRDFEDFEIYKIVFRDPPLISAGDGDESEDTKVSVMEDAIAIEIEVRVTTEKGEKSEERNLERLFEELDRFEDSIAIEMKEDETRSDLEKVVGELQKLEPVVMKKLGSESMVVATGDGSTYRPRAALISGEDKRTIQSTFSISSEDKRTVQSTISVESKPRRSDSSSSIGSYGSMRKEKEWKRTLACKLFEEIHNSEGGEEGMDSLWESYENDNSIKKSKNKKKIIIKNKTEFKYFDDEDEDEDEDRDEFMSNGQLCCLKALKLSTGKMNLGMGKPSLVKISKALKGFGWLHHVGSKNGKKH